MVKYQNSAKLSPRVPLAKAQYFGLDNVLPDKAKYNQRQRFWPLEFVNEMLRASRLPIM